MKPRRQLEVPLICAKAVRQVRIGRSGQRFAAALRSVDLDPTDWQIARAVVREYRRFIARSRNPVTQRS